MQTYLSTAAQARRRKCELHVELVFPRSYCCTQYDFLLGLTAVLTSKRLTALTSLLRDPTITVTCPCSPWTYATLKYIRSSSSSSSSSSLAVGMILSSVCLSVRPSVRLSATNVYCG